MKYLNITNTINENDWKFALIEIAHQLERIADGLHGDLECEEDTVKINVEGMNKKA